MLRLAFGPQRPLIEEIRTAAQRHAGGRFRLSVAWAREEGVVWLLHALSPHINNLDVVVGINEGGTTVEALLRLLPAVQSLTVFFKHSRQTFHPKLYLFQSGAGATKQATIMVGSSNLTHGGLVTNFESSLIADMGPGGLSADAQQLLATAESDWNFLTNSQYAYDISSEQDIKELYDAGYLVLERTARGRRRLETRQSREPNAVVLPTAPPAVVRPPMHNGVAIPFAIRPEVMVELPAENSDPQGFTPMPDRFFVRTLTANDVNKLHGQTPGTFEPDLGQTARNQYPAFWGWQNRYSVNADTKYQRLEWNATAMLISSLTPASGILINMTLWFRDARPEHPAEHRMGLNPIPAVRAVVPPNFDTDSLMVVERAPETAAHDFVVRFVTSIDPNYQDYSSYLTEIRPHHRYGYGP